MNGWIGTAVRRSEDLRFVQGHGRYTADLRMTGEAWLHVVRSPHAHALVGEIDAGAARQIAGVLCVLTGRDYLADELGAFPAEPPPLGPVSKVRGEVFSPPNVVLASDRVRYVGEPVAIVVAESADIAENAAEQVRIAYAPLPAVTSIDAARQPAAPRVWEEAKDNTAAIIDIGDAAACDAAFARADLVVSTTVTNNRVIGSPMEPRAAIGYVDDATGALTLVSGTQLPNRTKEFLARHVFRLPDDQIRVVSPDMGGGFGTRATVFPEYVFVLWCARRLGRPVKWVGSRLESFLSDPHGRDSLWSASLALEKSGRILGLRVQTWANLGAYPGHAGMLVPVSAGPRVQTGVYDIPAMDMQVHVLFTNTSNVAPYRGAGQPEAIYLIERLLDICARRSGIDRVALRRLNLIPTAAFPYRSASGAVYDSGDYEAGMEAALEASDWSGFADRAAMSEQSGKLRGIGIANYVQVSGGRPDEWGRLDVAGDGTVVFYVGTHSHGQGHETTYAQIVAGRLGVPFEQVRIVDGDTGVVALGGGTHGSRSLFKAGEIIVRCASAIVEKARQIAGVMFQVAPERVRYDRGRLIVEDTHLAADIHEVARFAQELGADGGPAGGGLSAELHQRILEANYPSGTHVCEVEIDPQTGVTTIVRYVAVDDAGCLINPMVAEGQIHGGIVQGIGQALLENIVYSADDAQLLTASFMDYALPRASDLPNLEVMFQEVPSPTNTLGVKGIGESGSTGAPPAVIGAIADALDRFGVCHIEMPATPEKIWRTIAGQGDAARDVLLARPRRERA